MRCLKIEYAKIYWHISMLFSMTWAGPTLHLYFYFASLIIQIIHLKQHLINLNWWQVTSNFVALGHSICSGTTIQSYVSNNNHYKTYRMLSEKYAYQKVHVYCIKYRNKLSTFYLSYVFESHNINIVYTTDLETLHSFYDRETSQPF